MWLENKIFHEDLEYITNQEFIQWRRLQNKTVFITGGTGLIGFYVINSLLFYIKSRIKRLRIIENRSDGQFLSFMGSCKFAFDC